jgi:hypothetical protein
VTINEFSHIKGNFRTRRKYCIVIYSVQLKDLNLKIKFLHQPYPYSFQSSRRIKQLFPIGLSVFAFLVLFKPFGLSNDPNYIQSSAFLSFFGTLIGLLTTVIVPFSFPKFFDESKWTLKRNLFWNVGEFFCFAVLMFVAFNSYYSIRYGYNNNSTFDTFGWWIYINLIFGVPLTFFVHVLNQYYLLKKHLKIADSINTAIGEKGMPAFPIFLECEVNRYRKVRIAVDDIIYVEAVGNYVNIIYQDHGVKKIIIRETLGNIEQKTQSSETIYKPHRSYLVNLNEIEKVTGDAQGLKILLKNTEAIIPVTRNKIKEFRLLVSSKT